MDTSDSSNGVFGFGGGGLDQSSVAKQMAALSAAGHARMQAQVAPGGPAVQQQQRVGQSSAPTATATTMASTMGGGGPGAMSGQQAAMMQQQHMQRKRGFLNGLAQVHFQRGQPLPPPFIGASMPGYDPNNSPWARLNVGSEPGKLRMGQGPNKEIDVFNVFTIMQRQGSLAKMSEDNLWPTLFAYLELNPGETQQLTQTIIGILGPLEALLRQRNAQAQQQQQQQQQQQALAGGAPPDITRSTSTAPGMEAAAASTPQANSPTMDRDSDAETRKRKLTMEQPDAKRARQKTDEPSEGPVTDAASSPPSSSSAPPSATAPAPPGSPRRRRVEYRPHVRTVDSEYGGRNLEARFSDIRAASVRQVRQMDEWGSLDIEALVLSLRSRLPTEISYALGSLTMVSILRSGATGFPLHMAGDLLEEVLDLLEESAGLEGVEDKDEEGEGELVTHKQVTQAVIDNANKLFSSLHTEKEETPRGPLPRAADVILTIVNIIRNLAGPHMNAEILGRHARTVPLLLRLCGVRRAPSGTLQPVISVLNLNDLATVRRDTMYLLLSVGRELSFSTKLTESPSPASLLLAKRTFSLLASFLIDPSAQPPSLLLMESGTTRPPPTMEAAADAFCATAQRDESRRVIARAVPSAWLDELFRSLFIRMPITDTDFRLLAEETWLGYVERCLMGLFTLAFIAPPSLRKTWKTDRTLGLPKLFAKLVKRFTVNVQASMKPFLSICARRAVETLTLLESDVDSFEEAKQAASAGAESSVLAFGMGYGDEADEKAGESGEGMLAAFADDLLWGVMMQKDVINDDGMFQELISLVRVDFPLLTV